MGDQSRSDIHAEAIAKPLKSNSDAIWGTVQKVHCCMPNPGYLLGDPGSCSCFGSLIIIDERCPVKARFGESAALIFLRLDRLVWDLLGRASGPITSKTSEKIMSGSDPESWRRAETREVEIVNQSESFRILCVQVAEPNSVRLNKKLENI